jgi:uncharacterized membrane protein
MTKAEFLRSLGRKLSSLPRSEVDERISFYSEMIDDRMEEGLSESGAIEEIGSLDTVAHEIISSSYREAEDRMSERIPLAKRKRSALSITLLAVGSPIWLSLIIALFAVAFSLWISAIAVSFSLAISILALVIVAWALFVAFLLCAPALAIVGLIGIIEGNAAEGLMSIGGGLISAGLAIYAFYLAKLFTLSVGSIMTWFIKLPLKITLLAFRRRNK